MHELGRFPDARRTKTHVFSLCGNSIPSEHFRTPALWRDVPSCLFIFHPAESEAADAVENLRARGVDS